MRQLRAVDDLRAPGWRSQPRASTSVLRALLTDLDGTLLATNALHAAAWCDAFRAHGYPVQPQVLAPMIGMGADKIVPLVAAGLRFDEGLGRAIADDHNRRFLEGYLEVAKPTPGARDLLVALREAGVRVYVASSAQGRERDAALERAGVADLVEPPPGKTHASKPDADVIVEVLAQTGVDPRAACMLGDTPYDIDAAARAGLPAVAVRCGGWSDRALSGAAAIYDDPADIVEHLDEWPLPHGKNAAQR